MHTINVCPLCQACETTTDAGKPYTDHICPTCLTNDADTDTGWY